MAARPKNQVGLEEARKIDAASKMSARQWEKRVGMLLKVNGWTHFRDLDRPTEYAKRRIPGFPDYIAYKYIGRRAVFFFVECKTGKATMTEAQEGWITAARKCPTPCVVGVVVRPENERDLVELLGGEEIHG